jgi:hypothetical protein
MFRLQPEKKVTLKVANDAATFFLKEVPAFMLS